MKILICRTASVFDLANSAGPRRCLADQPNGQTRRPSQQQLRQRGREGSAAAAPHNCKSTMTGTCHLGTTKSSQLFDAQALADALRANKTITSVNLCHNKIGNEGFKAWPPQGAMARVCGTMRLSRETEPSFLHSHCVLSSSQFIIS